MCSLRAIALIIASILFAGFVFVHVRVFWSLRVHIDVIADMLT